MDRVVGRKCCWVSMKEVVSAESQAENQVQFCVFTKIFFKGTKEKTETSKPEHTAVELGELSFLLVQFIVLLPSLRVVKWQDSFCKGIFRT